MQALSSISSCNHTASNTQRKDKRPTFAHAARTKHGQNVNIQARLPNPTHLTYHMPMNNEQRIAQQIDRGMTRRQACMTLGIPYTPEPDLAPIDKAELRNMAIDTLSRLIEDMQRAPSSYKPNEIIAACKEALDRTEGKAVQTNIVEQNTTYTIVAAIPAPPNSMPVIEHKEAPSE